MKKLTKLEIIAETYEAYKDPKNRGFNGQSCQYITHNNKNCAVGRCMTDEYIKYLQRECKEENTISKLLNNPFDTNMIINDSKMLKEQYLGHELSFWTKLQRWHDLNNNFDTDKISTRGEQRIKNLIEEYS